MFLQKYYTLSQAISCPTYKVHIEAIASQMLSFIKNYYNIVSMLFFLSIVSIFLRPFSYDFLSERFLRIFT